MAAAGSFSAAGDRSPKDDRIHVSAKGYTSNDFRTRAIDEQREIRDFKTPLFLRQQIPQQYDMFTHAAYVGTPALLVACLTVYMSGRVRSDTLARMARPFVVSSTLAGAGIGQMAFQCYHMQRWRWENEFDV